MSELGLTCLLAPNRNSNMFTARVNGSKTAILDECRVTQLAMEQLNAWQPAVNIEPVVNHPMPILCTRHSPQVVWSVSNTHTEMKRHPEQHPLHTEL